MSKRVPHLLILFTLYYYPIPFIHPTDDITEENYIELFPSDAQLDDPTLFKVVYQVTQGAIQLYSNADTNNERRFYYKIFVINNPKPVDKEVSIVSQLTDIRGN